MSGDIPVPGHVARRGVRGSVDPILVAFSEAHTILTSRQVVVANTRVLRMPVTVAFQIARVPARPRAFRMVAFFAQAVFATLSPSTDVKISRIFRLLLASTVMERLRGPFAGQLEGEEVFVASSSRDVLISVLVRTRLYSERRRRTGTGRTCSRLWSFSSLDQCAAPRLPTDGFQMSRGLR